jgi:hypothetical protein
MVVSGLNGLLICQGRIQVNSYRSSGSRPLRAEVVGWTDDQHTASHPIGQVLMGDPQSEASFSRRRRCRREKIRTRMGQNIGRGASLPLAQLGRPGRQDHRSLFFMVTVG